jgi:hypothetical protein
MGGQVPLSHAKIIKGTGRAVAVAAGSNTTDAVAMGPQTRFCALSLAPAATGYVALVTISQGGTAATATADLAIKSSDPPLLVGCAPGDKVSVWGITGTGELYVTEMTY